MIAKIKFALLATLMITVLAACSKQDDKKAIIGIWHVTKQTVHGAVVGDGKDWIEFKGDGSCNTRPRPGGYESGTYTIDDTKKTVQMRGQGGGIVYNYFLDGDSLRLETTTTETERAALYAVRTDKYPITADQEPLEDLDEPDVIMTPPPAGN